MYIIIYIYTHICAACMADGIQCVSICMYFTIYIVIIYIYICTSIADGIKKMRALHSDNENINVNRDFWRGKITQ
jgi:hypothetical protein